MYNGLGFCCISLLYPLFAQNIQLFHIVHRITLKLLILTFKVLYYLALNHLPRVSFEKNCVFFFKKKI